MALDRGTRKQEVNLVVAVAITAEIFDDAFLFSSRSAQTSPREKSGGGGLTKSSLPIRNIDIQIMLFPMLINAESLKINVPSRTKLRFHRAGNVNRTLEAQIRHAVLNDLEIDRYHPSHFNGAAK